VIPEFTDGASDPESIPTFFVLPVTLAVVVVVGLSLVVHLKKRKQGQKK
jgi:hypothetical protein